jgi:hypothetical protein
MTCQISGRLTSQKTQPNTACTDEVGSQGRRVKTSIGIMNCAEQNNKSTPPSQDARNVGRSCIMNESDEPVKPLCGSPLGVHTILCLGRRSLFCGGRQWDRFLFAPGNAGQFVPEFQYIETLARKLGSGLSF